MGVQDSDRQRYVRLWQRDAGFWQRDAGFWQRDAGFFKNESRWLWQEGRHGDLAEGKIWTKYGVLSVRGVQASARQTVRLYCSHREMQGSERLRDKRFWQVMAHRVVVGTDLSLFRLLPVHTVSPSVPEMEGIYATGVCVCVGRGGGGILFEAVPLVRMYIAFTRTPGESYRRRLRSLLCLCDVFRALINSHLRVERSIQGSGWKGETGFRNTGPVHYSREHLKKGDPNSCLPERVRLSWNTSTAVVKIQGQSKTKRRLVRTMIPVSVWFPNSPFWFVSTCKSPQGRSGKTRRRSGAQNRWFLAQSTHTLKWTGLFWYCLHAQWYELDWVLVVQSAYTLTWTVLVLGTVYIHAKMN